MGFIRRHLGVGTFIWLFCQIASISALTAFDLQPTAYKDKDCLQAGPAEQCPMKTATGEPCPMHRGSTDAAHPRSGTCTLRGTSDASGSELANLFSLTGILPVVAIATINSQAPLASVTFNVPSPIVLSLDTPPPRS